jgi:hypothetical protein
MPSSSWQRWNTTRASELDEIEAAHRGIGGTGRGRRYATQQINHAYAVLLASQFQGFCRDLHSECVDYLVRALAPPPTLETVLRYEFTLNRKLDLGNPNPGNIGADFSRLGIEFWKEVDVDSSLNRKRQKMLDDLNNWRNAIAHQDFDPRKLSGTKTLRLARVRRWRKACEGLAHSFDNVMRAYIQTVTGTLPW